MAESVHRPDISGIEVTKNTAEAFLDTLRENPWILDEHVRNLAASGREDFKAIRDLANVLPTLEGMDPEDIDAFIDDQLRLFAVSDLLQQRQAGVLELEEITGGVDFDPTDIEAMNQLETFTQKLGNIARQ